MGNIPFLQSQVKNSMYAGEYIHANNKNAHKQKRSLQDFVYLHVILIIILVYHSYHGVRTSQCTSQKHSHMLQPLSDVLRLRFKNVEHTYKHVPNIH